MTSKRSSWFAITWLTKSEENENELIHAIKPEDAVADELSDNFNAIEAASCNSSPVGHDNASDTSVSEIYEEKDRDMNIQTRSLTFNDGVLEEAYLVHLCSNGMVTRGIWYFVPASIYLSSLTPHVVGQECQNEGDFCDFPFWIPRLFSGLTSALMVIIMICMIRFEKYRSWMSSFGRYQKIVLTINLLLYLSSGSGAIIKEVFNSNKELYICSLNPDSTFCPSFPWWMAQISEKLVLNFNSSIFCGLEWRNILVMNLVWLLCAVVACIPITVEEDGVEYEYLNFTGYTALAMTSCVFAQLVVLRLTYLVDRSRREKFLQTAQALKLQISIEDTLAQMLPPRLVNRCGVRNAIGVEPELFAEEFHLCTIMFCSFNKTDVHQFSDPSTFFDLLGNLFVQFDHAVKSHNLFKLEHVCQDYVVGSLALKYGPQSEFCKIEQQKTDAKNLINLATVLLDISKACVSPCGKKLNFKVGIHSGSVIGAVAGRNRRFYRLFGDTINTAARMCHHAPAGRIQISNDTKNLLPSLKLDPTMAKLEPQGQIEVKGKGMMTTFLIGEENHDQACAQLSEATTDRYSHADDAVSSVGGATYRSTEGLALRSALSFRSKSKSGTNESRDSDSEGDQVHETLFQPSDLHPLHHTFLDRKMEAEFLQDNLVELRRHSKEVLMTGTIYCLCFVVFSAVITEEEERKFSRVLVLVAVGLLGLLFGYKRLHVKSITVSTVMSVSQVAVIFQSAIILAQAFFLDYAKNIPHIAVHSVPMIQITSRTSLPTLFYQVQGFLLVASIALGNRYDNFLVIMAVGGCFCSFCVSHVFIQRDSRRLWESRHRRAEQYLRLEQVLHDLLPSARARDFVFKRQTKLDGNMIVSGQNFDASWARNDCPAACILSIDMVDFTRTSMDLGPQGVVQLLHELWCLMDKAVENSADTYDTSPKADIYESEKSYCDRASSHLGQGTPVRAFKMDTIGDAYIVAILLESPDNAEESFSACLMMLRIAEQIALSVHRYQPNQVLGIAPGSVKIRLGMAIGSVLAGVVGIIKPRYHIFGDAVSRSAALESQSMPFHVKVGEEILQIFADLDSPLINLIDGLPQQITCALTGALSDGLQPETGNQG